MTSQTQKIRKVLRILAKAYLELYMDLLGGAGGGGLKKERGRKTGKLDKTLSAFTKLMSPCVTDLEYLMLKLLAKSLILCLAEGPEDTGVGICSFAMDELAVIMDAFNKF